MHLAAGADLTARVAVQLDEGEQLNSSAIIVSSTKRSRVDMAFPGEAMSTLSNILAAVCFVCFAAQRSFGANAIQIENAKPGDSTWQLTDAGRASGTIEGYASATSVNRGDQIRLFVNTAESAYTLTIYRLGYYGGTGGRKMLGPITRRGGAQPACPMDAFGTVECRWLNPYVLSVPRTTDPTDWMSGIYVAKLTAGRAANSSTSSSRSGTTAAHPI
jgi:hypothetical protein